MKRSLITSIAILLLCSSCTSSLAKLSDKAQRFGSILTSKVSSLFDKEMEDNRLVVTSAEFYGTMEDEFIPLDQNEIDSRIIATPIPQPAETPGVSGSSIPSIQSFSNPDNILSNIFKKIYFNTDQYVPKTLEAKGDLQKIAHYLKKHKHTYIFIEGHCDERASESYNLALGTKRANTIRTILINYGAHPNQLHCISYGKERPAVKGKTKAAYARNRRVSFKIYSKDK